jgi:hypothetical protein
MRGYLPTTKFDRQLAVLRTAGCERVFKGKESGRDPNSKEQSIHSGPGMCSSSPSGIEQHAR